MDIDVKFMQMALEEARIAAKQGEVPVGAVIVKEEDFVCSAHNKREEKEDVSSHAEIEAMKEAAEILGDWRLDGCTLYVTLEPCLMCAGAIIQSRISRVVFGALDPDRGAIVSKLHAFEYYKSDSNPLVTPGVLEKECRDMLKGFFNEKR